MPPPIPFSTARELQLHIEPARDAGGSAGYLVRAAAFQPTQETSAFFPANWLDDAAYRQRLATLARGQPVSDAELQAIAARHFDAIFRASARDLLRDQQARLLPGQRLQLTLEIEAGELHGLPWELLYDPWQKRLLGDGDAVIVLRRVHPPQPMPPPPAVRGLHLHIILSQPKDAPELRAAQEEALIRDALAAEERAGRLRITSSGGKLSQIAPALAGQPHILHFIGHGGFDEHGEPAIFLEKEDDGNGFPATAAYLIRSVLPPASRSDALRLILLNACQTSSAPSTLGYNSLAHALAPHSRAVIAMQYPISDASAGRFASAFYQSLAAGQPLDEAFSQARQAIRSGSRADQRDAQSPVLIASEGMLTLQREWQPFKGPRPYSPADRRWFQGRESETSGLQAHVARHAVSLVWGKSNAGKTSLLQAGFLPEQQTRLSVALALVPELEQALRLAVDTALAARQRPPLAAGALDSTLPDDLAIILDQAEQCLHNPRHAALPTLQTLAAWAQTGVSNDSASRLVLIVRQDEDHPPALEQWQALLGGVRPAALELVALDRDRIAAVIETLTRLTPVRFTPEAITEILEKLEYEQERSMLKAQVVCQALYEYARSHNLAEITPELINGPDLNGVSGILRVELEMRDKIARFVEKHGPIAQRLLVEFLQNGEGATRPALEESLLLRSGAPPEETLRALDSLVEEKILYAEPALDWELPIGGAPLRLSQQKNYELAHDGLAACIAPWFDERARSLRVLDEIFSQTGGGLIALRGEPGGLADLQTAAAAGPLPIRRAQQALMLRSALEAGFATESEAAACFAAISRAAPDSDVQLAALTHPHLSGLARQRAARRLAVFAQANDSRGERARQALAALALDDSPATQEAAGMALAPVAEPHWLASQFPPGQPAARTALAHIFDASGVLPANQPGGDIRRRLWQLRGAGAAGRALQGGLLLAAGFMLVSLYNWYRNALSLRPPPEAILALLPVALLSFTLTLPGGFALALLRNAIHLLGGGRRARWAGAGALAGGAAGLALAVTPLSALTQSIRVDMPFDWLPTFGAAVFGLLAAITWLPTLLLPRLPQRWRHIAAWGALAVSGVGGALALYWLYAPGGVEWWLRASLLLYPASDADALFAGALLSVSIALALHRGQLAPLSNHQ